MCIRDSDYDIQTEFGDLGNLLAYLSFGDRAKDVERLVAALAEIRRRFRRPGQDMFDQEYISPVVTMTPHRAFYAAKESVPLAKTEGRICAEFVMSYPPGIPILAPGETITEEIIRYIVYSKDKGCSLTGPEDMAVEHLNVIKEG